ncbi:MAG: YihY/virulence factor BrkB family protein, partial [Pseudomonadota bacterium]
YTFVPNTRVNASAALVGGVTAGLLWATVGKLFASFASGATNYTAIYSTFAIAVLALFWLYINWLILLVGSKISYYYQNPDRLRTGSERIPLSSELRERLGVSVMYLVGADFRHREPGWSINGIAAHLRMPAEMVAQVVSDLLASSLLVVTEDEHLVPAREMDSISVADILSAVRSDRQTTLPRDRLQIEPVNRVLDSVEKALSDSTTGVTLRSLVAPTRVDDPGEGEERRSRSG